MAYSSLLQAWDQADRRMARWEYTKKQVNPNVAMHLVAEVPPIVRCICTDEFALLTFYLFCSHERVISCDGGGGALGHPKVYINLVSVATRVHCSVVDEVSMHHVAACSCPNPS